VETILAPKQRAKRKKNGMRSERTRERRGGKSAELKKKNKTLLKGRGEDKERAAVGLAELAHALRVRERDRKRKKSAEKKAD